MAEHARGFSTTDETQVLSAITNTLYALSDECAAAGETPDWTTLQVVRKSLPTGWPQMPNVLAYGIVIQAS